MEVATATSSVAREYGRKMAWNGIEPEVSGYTGALKPGTSAMLLSLLVSFVTLLSANVSASPAPTDSADDIQWMTFEEAVAQVKSDKEAGLDGKMVFIEIYATWCPYCKRLDANTMTDPEVIEMLNTRFYPVRLDGEAERDIAFNGHTFKFVPNGERGYHELAVGLSGGQLSYPTLVFINEDLQVVQPLAGYREPGELLPILSFFGDGHYTSTPWETFIESYESKADAAR